MNSHRLKTLKIAIAGSTDDGKSTLIGRLLIDSGNATDDQLEAIAEESLRLGRPTPEIAWLTDGLSIEQTKLITIDVAYRTIRWQGYRLQLIDTPGHLEYIHNTATGLSQSDVLVLLIDISRQITPQTLRHLQLAKMFQIRHVAVVVNKMDTVGYRKRDFDTFLTHQFLPRCSHLLPGGTEIIPSSALEGHNIVYNLNKTAWYSGVTLMEFLLRSAHLQAQHRPAPTDCSLAKVYWTSEAPALTGIKLLSGRLQPGDTLYRYSDSALLQIREAYHYTTSASTIHPGQMAVIAHHPTRLEAGCQLISSVQWIHRPHTLTLSALVTDTIHVSEPHHWHTEAGTFQVTISSVTAEDPTQSPSHTTAHFARIQIQIPAYTPAMESFISKGLLIAPYGRLVAITGQVHPSAIP